LRETVIMLNYASGMRPADDIFLHIIMGNIAQIDWDHLRIFLAVARAGRVAAAARRLGIEHTTVSRRVASLERQVGAQLFYRTASGYLLTSVGKRVLANAESMERAAVTIGAAAGESAGRPSGLVRLGIPPEFASDWLAPHLPAFHSRYPEVQLQILVGTRTLDLSRGEAELALRTPRPHQTGLVTARIARGALGLYASKTFVRRKALRIEDAESARGIPLLVYTEQLQLLQDASWFQPVMEAATVMLQTNGTHVLLAAARASVGVAVLPRFVARNHDDLVAVSDNVAEHEIWLVTHPEFRRDPKVRATADFLKEVAKGPAGIC
jgi:DNA-binding transcriptional LysR family regulator